MTWFTSYEILRDIQRTVHELAAKVAVMSDQQAELNTDVATLIAAVQAVADEITALKNANPQLDLTGLEAAIASVQALAPPAQAS